MKQLIKSPLAVVMGFCCFISNAQADPVIGIDLLGGGNFTYADKFSDRTDTGVDEVLTGTGFGVGDVHQFTTQVVIDSMTNGAATVTPTELNNTHELTKLVKFQDQVQSAFLNPPDPTQGTVIFEHRDDNFTNLQLVVDDITDGTQNVPEANAGTVDCYGAGCVHNGLDDGLVVLEGNLISNSSQFTNFSATTGQGTFNLVFEITSHNSNYIDLSNLPNQPNGNPIYAITFDGSTFLPNLPGGFDPATMWDGTSTTGTGPSGVDNRTFRLAGESESFRESAVPVPGSLLLMGSALIGLFGVRKRNRA